MMISMTTSQGLVRIELDTENTPMTAENFAEYVRSAHFNGTIFHRVIPGFMIQGGGFSKDMLQKETRATIENEAHLGQSNKRGTLAMARTSDPHSASSQFFINVKDNDFLNFSSKTTNGWGYCVFGKVVEGMDVVDQIVMQPTTSRNGHQDVPINEIVIESVEITEKEVA